MHETSCEYAGTPAYMAPECVNEAPYAKPADVWALGCVLFDLCARRPAFSAFDLQGTLTKIRSGRVPVLPKIYSSELRTLARSMLYTDEARRPTADEVLHAPALAEAKAHVDAAYGPELPCAAAAVPYSEARAPPDVQQLLARFRAAAADADANAQPCASRLPQASGSGAAKANIRQRRHTTSARVKSQQPQAVVGWGAPAGAQSTAAAAAPQRATIGLQADRTGSAVPQGKASSGLRKPAIAACQTK